MLIYFSSLLSKKQNLFCQGPRREPGGGRGGAAGVSRATAPHFHRWDLFSRALDGVQIQCKWRYTDLNVLVSFGQVF